MAAPTPSASSDGRGQWGSKLGFILAAAGSAIGLGNIWRFPIEAANNGGCAFLIIYLACVLFIGYPVMLAELTIGRHTRRNPVGAIKKVLPGSAWFLVGSLGVVTGLAILSYYCVVAGWTVGYIVKSAAHSFPEGIEPAEVKNQFLEFVASPWLQIGLLAVFIAMCVGVVWGGVKAGIERWSKILMPVLLGLLVVLAVRSLTLPGAEKGIEFYLSPDFSKIDFKVLVAALGQAFFSLSLGMGAMITYGSYLSRDDNLTTSAAWVSAADTAIAFTAGLIILPALGAVGMQPGVDQGGAGLIFAVLPKIFSELPWQPWGGVIFGVLFFLLLAIAALTSAVSLLEVVTAYLIDERGWGRHRAVAVVGGASFLLGIPSALSLGAIPALSSMISIKGRTMGFLDVMDTAFGKLSLTLGSLLICIIVGWLWGAPRAVEEIKSGCPNVGRFGTLWTWLVRLVCPLAILLILGSLLFDPSAIR